MSERTYAVFLFPQGLEALGDAIKPYMSEGPAGAHVRCHEVDTSGALVQMRLITEDQHGNPLEMELMVPTGMVRMIASVRSEQDFGFM